MKQLNIFVRKVEFLFEEKLSLFLKNCQPAFKTFSSIFDFFHQQIAPCEVEVVSWVARGDLKSYIEIILGLFFLTQLKLKKTLTREYFWVVVVKIGRL